MILVKIAVTSAMVLALSSISERVGTRAAGILAGFPLGIAISLFFIGVQQGAPFAAASAVSTLGGLGSTLVFCFAYWQASRRVRRFELAAASVCGFAAFLLAATALGALPQNRWLLAGVTAALSVVFALVFRRIPETAAPTRLPLGAKTLAIRVAAASGLVLVVTGLAGIVGEKWAGLLAGFPLTLCPVLLIAHATYGKEAAHGIIKSFPFGIGSLIVCALVASLVLAPLGVYGGMAVAIAAASAYLALLAPLILRRRGG